MSEYGAPPTFLGKFELDWDEYMHYMYLPVMMELHRDVRLPKNLEFLEYMLTYARGYVASMARYDFVYISARRGWATPGNPLNRPGWHSDGFGTDDLNFIWADSYPTLFAVQEFEGIIGDHIISAAQFEQQVDPTKIVTYPDKCLLALDPSVIHAAPEIPAPGGERAFLKISFSNSKYNLVGNSHNYLFDYKWTMHDREAVRNDPSYAGGDSYGR